MNLLLDTHALLWLFGDSGKLSRASSSAIADPKNTIHVSAVSAYEISLKLRFSRLDIAGGFESLRLNVDRLQFARLAISFEHCAAAGNLDLRHRDPFDRMLAAQSALEDMPLVTMDSAFALFGIRTLW